MINDLYTEKLILKACLQNTYYSTILSKYFKPSIISNPYISDVLEFVVNHHKKYNSIPNKEIIIENVKNKEKCSDTIEQCMSCETDFSENCENLRSNLDYLIDISDKYIKKQMLKNAIINSVDTLGDDDSQIKENDYEKIRSEISDAISFSMIDNFGLNYFGDMKQRLNDIFNSKEIHVPTHYPILDECISGGLGQNSLSVILGKIHGFKSSTFANMASRQVLNGKNVLIITLEMSEFAYAQRHDAIFTLMDINKMYLSSNRKEFINRLKKIKSDPNRGSLFIKQYPTGCASANDIRVYLKEMIMRNFKFDVIYVDYLNLMKPSYKGEKSDLYRDGKAISEELRAISMDFNGVPVVTGSQLNRDGSFMSLEDVDFNYTQESHGIPATSDFMIILGVDEDNLIYQSELSGKIVKNRFGGRIGEVIKFYTDSKTLRMYDETELDLWLADAKITNDNRDLNKTKSEAKSERKRKGKYK